ncbi:cytochrome P450 4c21-like [Culicoides brevitarsis]|uniref:cytochrome P450 4c21-like n=1 Tax=Culicoides brevitarsis TaxID=469753 RepID=UPI00307CA0E4
MDIITAILLLICIVALLYWKYRQIIKWADVIPGYEEPFSEKPSVKALFASRERRMELTMERATKYPRIYRIYFDLWPKVMLTDPELVKVALTSTKCLKKPDFYRFFGWGAGLVTAPVDSWKVHRKLLNPAFGVGAVHSFIPVFDQCSKEFAKILEPHIDGKEFDLLDYSVKATLDSICATSFGVKVDAQKKKLEFNKYLQRVHEIVAMRVTKIQLRPDFVFRFTKYFKENIHVRNECIKFGDKLIEQRKSMIKNDQKLEICEENDDDIPQKPKIFVDHLLKGDGCHFTESEIRDHVFTTISAGNETTALAIANTILFIAIHPDIQERLVEELQQVFYDESIEIDIDQLSKLKYMEMVLKEVLRLCPSVPAWARETTDDMYIDGYRIPKGTEMIFVGYAIHRRKEDWGPDPGKFDPDRFLPENSANRHPYSYLPFSAGSRNCIGKRYAMISLKIMLTNLLMSYKFKTSLKWSDIKWKMDIHLHITKPHSVSIEKREFFTPVQNIFEKYQNRFCVER